MSQTLSMLCLALICVTSTCLGQSSDRDIRPILDYGVTFVPQSEWSLKPRGGVEANGMRRNLAVGDSLIWHGLLVSNRAMQAAGTDPDSVDLTLEFGSAVESRRAAEETAFAWNGFRIAVLAVRTDSTELGAVKTELEIAELSSLPDSIAAMDSTGGPSYRLKVPQEIKSLVLHHSGSPEPLRLEDDPIEKLRALQDWSASDRNWWDVPYHLLLDLDGRVLEGRDYRYAGDTNTRYDPGGYLIVSVLGNYDLQEPTDAQIEALALIFAWAINEFDIPEDQIIGHSDVANTDCPGEGLRGPLKDGTLFALARKIEPLSR